MRITGTPEAFVFWGAFMLATAIAGLVVLPPTRGAILGIVACAGVGAFGALCVVAGMGGLQ